MSRIEQSRAVDVRPLRGAVLRPGQPVERLVYPGDDDLGTLHLSAFADAARPGTPSSIASFYLEAVPDSVKASRCGVSPGSPGVRIRGMATDEAFRGRGLGGRLVEHGLGLVRARGDRVEAAWCNARSSAAGYYEKLGFVVASPLFDLPDIGEHVVMVRTER